MKKHFSLGLVLIALLISCNKENEPVTDKYNINGYFQKGPFVKGASISISELNNDLSQTGKTFITIIPDDKGSFEISNLELASNYIYISADGYFYNEIAGELSHENNSDTVTRMKVIQYR